MISFAPITGRCLLRFPGENQGLVSQPMPPVERSTFAGAAEEVIDAYLVVRESGEIAFGRRCGAKPRMEWSGELPREWIPAWTEEVFASLDFQIDQLEEPA